MLAPGLTIRKGARGDVYKFKMNLYRDGVFQKTVYATFGRVGSIPLPEIVETCVRFARLIRQGIDPTGDGYVPPSALTVDFLMEHYVKDLEARKKSKRFRDDVVRRTQLYLGNWLTRPFVGLTKADVRLKHLQITNDHGPRVANQTITNFATAWKIAEQTLDGEFPECPAKYVRKNIENTSDYSWFELDKFWRDVGRAGPMLRLCWAFGILSGLRVGNLCSLRRDWVQHDRIIIPRDQMKVRDKKRGPFLVPLSEPMRVIVRRAEAYNSIVFPDSAFLFTSVSRDGRRLGTFQNIRPYGKVLRHAHRTACTNAEVHPELAAVLHDHSIVGIADRYTQRTVINYLVLLTAQEKISTQLLEAANLSVLIGSDVKLPTLKPAIPEFRYKDKSRNKKTRNKKARANLERLSRVPAKNNT